MSTAIETAFYLTGTACFTYCTASMLVDDFRRWRATWRHWQWKRANAPKPKEKRKPLL